VDTSLTARKLSRRRALVRGAAIAAGAAGVTAAMKPDAAAAADGESLVIGTTNDSDRVVPVSSSRKPHTLSPVSVRVRRRGARSG
jgi:hypothetical protein